MTKKGRNIVTAQERLNMLVDGIQQGQTRNVLMPQFLEKWKMSARTFDRFWKKANDVVREKQDQLQKQMAVVETEMAIEVKKKAIMTAAERKEFLSALIVKPTKLMKVAGSMVMVHQYQDESGETLHEILPMDVKLKAMAELNRMDGAYAPEKRDHTSGGEKLGGAPNLTDAQFTKLLDTIEAKSNTG